MYKIFIVCIVLILSGNLVTAKELKYPVSEIPAILKENAHTVFRIYKQVVEIKSEKSAVVSVTEVRTILNKNGEQDSYFSKTYDPMNKIGNIKGKVYNELGKQIKNLGSEDIIDQSAISGYSLYEDNRVKYIDPKNMTFPFTVEYTYEIDLKQTMFLPAWSHENENTSYENSEFIVKVPVGYTFRYKEFNLPNGVIKSKEEEKEFYTWKLSNLPARKNEPMASKYSPNYPLLLLGSNKFEFGDSKGSSQTWKELGIWVTSLNEKKDILPEATRAKMIEITANCKNEYEKVKVIYEYMQQKTRYVSVQVGIGGWQPFDATIVDKYSYGDCKALSNYTRSLLSVVGIKSFYTLVMAGSESKSIEASFPSSQFNHAMVCVPVEKDTLWLECTSQRLPCGFNSDFTDDRQVLLIDGENSRLVRTRAYTVNENCISRHSTVNLSDETTGQAEVKTVYKGLCYDNILPIYYADNADKKKIVTQRIELPSFILDKFSYIENKSQHPSFDENLSITISNYIHKMGKEVALLPLNFMNKLTSIPDKVRNRKTDLCIRRPYMENDTVVYQVPNEYRIAELPEKIVISGKFGIYTSNTFQQGNSVTYFRHFELYKGVFPPEAYIEFRDFLEKVSTADDAVASLKRTGNIAGIN